MAVTLRAVGVRVQETPEVGSFDGRAMGWAAASAVLVGVATLIGSRGLRHFDPALIGYFSATLFATAATVYRFVVWLERPPTAMIAKRGARVLAEPSRFFSNVGLLVSDVTNKLLLQRFIHKRGRVRGFMHLFLSWGTMLAFAVTFPLVFGWIHFELPDPSTNRYVVFLFGLPAGSFPLDTAVSWVTFHVLDIAAVLVLAGIGLSLWWRSSDPSPLTVQQFGQDLLPHVFLFGISTTGLMLTVSSHAMRGRFFDFFAITHAVVVILFLLYFPFGKLFHVWQRPLALALSLYRREAEATGPARCTRCAEGFSTRMQIDDLKQVLVELGFEYDGDAGHYQDVCPPCKRKQVGLAQRTALRASGARFL
jgi:hypothetical protein